MELLTSFLQDEPEEVLVNVAGALEQIVKSGVINLSAVKDAGTISPLIDLLTYTNTVRTFLYDNCDGNDGASPDTDAGKVLTH